MHISQESEQIDLEQCKEMVDSAEKDTDPSNDIARGPVYYGPNYDESSLTHYITELEWPVLKFWEMLDPDAVDAFVINDYFG